jgi:hypothetical protein
MREIERLLTKLPQRLIRRLKKVERPLKQARNVFDILRRSERSIVYTGYDFDYPEVRFRYSVGSRCYEHRLYVNGLPEASVKGARSEVLNKLFHHIGLSLVPDCFCLADFHEVHVEPCGFTASSQEFFEDFCQKGLGEVRYRNGLDPRRRTKFYFSGGHETPAPFNQAGEPTALALLGGGKESIVMGELLKQMGIPFKWFTFNRSHWGEHIQRVIDASGVQDAINIELRFDPRFHTDSKYTGTYPFLGPVSFVSLMVAHLMNVKYVVIGNERSANIGNLQYRGVDINHQYTKSFEFELAFDSYVRQNLLSGVKYCSLVRPLYEISISRLFSAFPQYFEHFVSCNNVYKGKTTARWCKACPKCAFVFIALYPFLGEDELKRVFGQDFFEIQSIREHILDLCKAKKRPFECIGTREECRLAVRLCLDKRRQSAFSKKPWKEDLTACCDGIDLNALRARYVDSFHEEHNIPEEWIQPLKLSIQNILKME